jgi:Tfp pilus assembly protein PilO
MNMNYVRLYRFFWTTNQIVRDSGWLTAIAASIGALCIGFCFLALNSLNNRISGLRQDAKIVHSKARITSQLASKTATSAEQLDTFYRFFPIRASISDSMARLYSAAASQGLSLDQGDYHLSNHRDAKLARYNIVLPVKGSYMQIRKFVAQALTDIPNLSLDSITFNRQKIEDASVEAQLNFTLYLGGE